MSGMHPQVQCPRARPCLVLNYWEGRPPHTIQKKLKKRGGSHCWYCDACSERGTAGLDHRGLDIGSESDFQAQQDRMGGSQLGLGSRKSVQAISRLSRSSRLSIPYEISPYPWLSFHAFTLRKLGECFATLASIKQRTSPPAMDQATEEP